MAETGIRHTLMREDVSYVNARMYGTARDSTTIWAALSAIGAAPCTLVLMAEEDGLWVLTTDVTIPANVTLSVPSGVTVTGTGALTLLGGVIALRADWYQSSGALTWQASTTPTIAASVRAGKLYLAQNPALTVQLQNSATGSPWTLTLPPTPGTPDQVLTGDGTGVTRWSDATDVLDPTLRALADLPTVANTLPYFTNTDQAALTTLTPYMRTLLDDPDGATACATLGATPAGTAQPLDATLTALAGLTTGANLLPYLSGVDQWATSPLSPYARTLLDDPDAATMRATLVLGALAPLSTITTPYLTDKAVTYGKVQDVAAGRLLGNTDASPGTMQEISVGAGLTLSGGVLSQAGGFVAGTGLADRVGLWSSASNVTYDDALIWDRANHWLGIGMTPTRVLDIDTILSIPAGTGDVVNTKIYAHNILGAISNRTSIGLEVDARLSQGGFASPGVSIIGAAIRARVNAGGGSAGVVTALLLESGNLVAGGTVNVGRGLYVLGPTGPGPLPGLYEHIALADFPVGNTGNYIGLRGLVTPGAARYNLFLDGTAQNYIGGNVGIGGLPSTQTLHVNGTTTVTTKLSVGSDLGTACKEEIVFNKTNQHAITIKTVDDGGGFASVLFINAAGSIPGSINQTASTTAYNTTSDVRMKNAITALTGALDVVQALRPVRFRWNVDDSEGRGFLAHELMQIVPEAVTGLPEQVNDDGTIRPQQVDHSRLIPWLTAAVQELLTQVGTLTERVATLEALV